MKIKESAKRAIYIGTLCSVSYLAVYLARNILSAVTPDMTANHGFSEAYIGRISSVYMIFYAVGQLINGAIGDKIKAKYMISFGLLLAGVTNLIFVFIPHIELAATFIYGITGFFLSMIYGPMTKVVSENTELIYATRCCLGYTFSSFFGTPLAGMLATFFAWKDIFIISSSTLFIMAVLCFGFFIYFEKKGIVKYGVYKKEKTGKGNLKVLLKREIVKFAFIAAITGIVRTTIVFWFPTYISQYLSFTPEKAASIFTVAGVLISASAFIAVFVYERLHSNMNLTIFIMFTISALAFGLVCIFKQPFLNIAFLTLAIMANDCASTMLWSRYCPSLYDTGMVSSATGFLDFLSYVTAAAESTLIGSTAESFGWRNIMLVCVVLMSSGILVTFKSVFFRKKAEN